MNKDFMKKLGTRIAMRRKELGLTQVEMADAFGCSQPMIAGYESGLRRLPVSFLPKLATMFGMSVDELIGHKPNKSKAKLKKPGPPSRLEKHLLAIQKLPRSKQQVVTEVLEGLIKQYQTS